MEARSPTLRALIVCLVTAACSSATPPPVAAVPPPAAATGAPSGTPSATPAATSSEPKCDVVCQGARVTALSAGTAQVTDADSHTVHQTANANHVFAAMHDDLLACYKARVRVAPNAQGTVTVDLVIGPDGKILRMDATGGETLGSAKECITKRIQKATFEPPHGGGTVNIHVPFTLRLQPADEST